VRRSQLFLVTGAGLLIAACGGGGGSSTTRPVTLPPVVVPSQPPITIESTGLPVGFQNQPYNFKIAVTVIGIDKTDNSIQGNLPLGIALTNNTILSGTPTQSGTFKFTYTVANSANSTVKAFKDFTMEILPPATVRNDALASATQLVCCGTLSASLSPYSTAAGAAAPDQDYYKITANPGDKISIDAVAIGTAIDTDTVIEVIDVNGSRMNVCNTPQATTGFNHPCLNDDINPGIIRNSHLEIQLPPTSGVFVVHVLDWLGRARPEMTYELRTAKLP
jgi:hypothetical protein